MPINKAEQQLAQQLTNRVLKLERDMADIKNAQLLGADSLVVERIPAAAQLTGGPYTIAAGSFLTFVITSTPANGTLTLWDFLHTLYIDAYDAAHAFPGGASTTAGMRNLFENTWTDWADSSDSSNIRVYKTRIYNNDVSSHDFWIDFRAYLPKLTGTGSA